MDNLSGGRRFVLSLGILALIVTGALWGLPRLTDTAGPVLSNILLGVPMAVFAVFMIRRQRRGYRKAEAHGDPAPYELESAVTGWRIFTWALAGILALGTAVAAWQGHYALLVPMLILVSMMVILSQEDVRHARVLDSRFREDGHEG